mmetsp:Transcript_24878/g.69178  ORF Transcript_24878/g.69178 Transcript_24878/m.69178 type:complete len:250 (-) Transcript_24878:26-775(-)
MSTFDETPDGDLELLLNTRCLDCLLYIQRRCLFQHTDTDEETLCLHAHRVQCHQMPRIQIDGVFLRTFVELVGMWEAGIRLVLALAGHRQRLASAQRDGWFGFEMLFHKAVQAIPRLLLATMQHSVFGRVGPEACRVRRQVIQSLLLVADRVHGHLIQRRAGHGHQWHLRWLQVLLLRIPLRRNGKRQALAWHGKRLPHRRLQRPSIQRNAKPLCFILRIRCDLCARSAWLQHGAQLRAVVTGRRTLHA